MLPSKEIIFFSGYKIRTNSILVGLLLIRVPISILFASINETTLLLSLLSKFERIIFTQLNRPLAIGLILIQTTVIWIIFQE